MATRALIVQGGWAGHQPQEVAEVLAEALKGRGVEVTVSDTLDSLAGAAKLKALNLIVPIWTMGEITKEQFDPLNEAVQSGVGLGGCHGGMCDAFRKNTEYQFMTGGQFVGHPGGDGTKYRITIADREHFITQGSADFEVSSEQYYMHVDPANHVLATTQFPVAPGPHTPNGPVTMPQLWTRRWGEGRVYYNALGHVADVVRKPEILRLMVRGLLWAAKAEALA